MAYVYLGEHWENMKTVLRSFGYAIIAKHPRLLCLAPGDDTIFIVRTLKRVGYWELSRCDRFTWEKYGALGYPMRPYMPAEELIRFMYDYATGCAGIQEGIALDPENAFRQPTYEPAEVRRDKRIKQQYLEADRQWANSNTKHNAKHKVEIDKRKKELRKALQDQNSEHMKARRAMNVVMENIDQPAYRKNRHKAK